MDHIRICATRDVRSGRTNGLEDVCLIHRTIPEINMEEVDTSINLFGHKLSFPFVIEAITGGTPRAESINRRLAAAAEKLHVAMGVGSQRIAVENPALATSFRIVRKTAPNAFLIANIGAPQLVMGYGVEEARKAVDMISADALAIHLNAVQESVQPEGELVTKGVLDKMKEITKHIGVPVIAKETGAGISAEDAVKLESTGVTCIDVAGVGGTDWAKVENYRKGRERKTFKSGGFYDWGISTAASLIEVTQSTKLRAIASGGIRDGLQIAKSVALGASAAGLARPLLSPAMASSHMVEEAIRAFHREFSTAMFLTGSRTVSDLQEAPLVITGDTFHWLSQRGFDTTRYSRRE